MRIVFCTLTLVLVHHGAITVAAISNGLYVCNESGEHVNVAYAEFNNDIWITKGWTSVENEECSQLTKNFANTRYYIYAVGASGKSWEADHRFCIDAQKDFTIPYADSTQACQSKNFFSVWIPYLVQQIFPDHYEVVIGPNNVGLNSPRAER